MRALLGSLCLSVGAFLLLATLLIARQNPEIPLGVKIASGGLAAVLVAASLILLLGNRGQPSGERIIVSLSLLTALAALLFALGSKNYAWGKYCGIEGFNQDYTLEVHIFGKVLHKESGPAVQHVEGDNISTGPSPELEMKMVCWELGLDVGLIAAGAIVGGLIGLVIQRLAKPAKVAT